jgi:TPR repeat protein
MPRGNRHWTRDWRLGGLVLLGLVITALVVLELWESAPDLLRGSRSMVVDGLHWLRSHWLTSGALGVIATLGVFELQRRAEHQRELREELRRKEEAQNEELRREEEARREKAQQAQAAIDERRKLLTANCWVDEATGWLPQVSDVQDPVALGVHPTTATEDLDVAPETSAETAALELPARVPLYVPRDLDATLDKALRAALARGGLVLVRGDSTAGKSRIAFEAMRRLPADLWLLIPYRRDSLRKLLAGGVKFRDVVVWLNDLEFHLGAGGLDVGLLRRLVGDGDRRVVVLATMRASEYNKRSPEHEHDQPEPERDVLRAERELLDQAVDFELPRQFSAAEQQRARDLDWDPRIAVALDHGDRYGLAEYIAAGPRLWRRWRSARDPGSPADAHAGAAMVAAALDCRRAGLSRPVSEELLRELYRDSAYLDPRAAGRLDPAVFEQGLAWATKVVQGASALLTRESEADGYEVFDYLLDTVQADPDAWSVPPRVWEHLLSDLQVDDALAVGLAAYQADEHGVAERAWQLAADADHHDAQYNLGILLQQRGDLEEAEQWYRRAADAGHHDAEYNLGALLKDLERLEEAEHWLRRAADAGHHDAESAFRALLEQRNNQQETEHWYRRTADAGH